jgi:hypothetical protein
MLQTQTIVRSKHLTTLTCLSDFSAALDVCLASPGYAGRVESIKKI